MPLLYLQGRRHTPAADTMRTVRTAVGCPPNRGKVHLSHTDVSTRMRRANESWRCTYQQTTCDSLMDEVKERLPAWAFGLVCGLLLMSAAPAQQPNQNQGQPPAPVVVFEALQREMAPVAWYAGTVISRNDARVAAEVEGRLVEVAEVGTVVRNGAVLARIDDTFIQEQLREDEAAVERAEARLVFFTREVQRLSRLARQSNAAESQLDQAVADKAVTQSDLNAARARVARDREQIKRALLRAPFDGVVTERLKVGGEWAQEGDVVVRLVDPARLEVQTWVPVHVLAHIQTGRVLRIRAGTKQDQARVENIVPVGDDRSRLYELRLAPTESDWRAGYTVRVAVPTAEPRRVIAVPRDALVVRREGTRVFRIDDAGAAEAVDVTVGLAVGDFVEVRGGVQVGDRVVTRGGERLRAGQQVSIINDGPH